MVHCAVRPVVHIELRLFPLFHPLSCVHYYTDCWWYIPYFMLVGLLHIFIFIICMLFWRLVLHYSCGRGYIGIIPKFFSRNPASDPNAKCCWQTCRRRSRFQISQHYFEVLHGNACHLLHIEVNRTNNAYNISLASLVCSKIESTF